jgi:hypothetical protein
MEGIALAEYVSSHPTMPAAINLEFERVLCPLLLDNVNRYAGAEYTRAQVAPIVHCTVTAEQRFNAPHTLTQFFCSLPWDSERIGGKGSVRGGEGVHQSRAVESFD